MVVVLGSGPGRSSCLVILILTQIFSQDKLDFHALQSDMRNMLNLQAEHNISTEIKYYQISDGTKQIFLYWQRAGYFSIFSRPSCGSLHVVQTLVSSQHHQGGGSRYSDGLFIVWVFSLLTNSILVRPVTNGGRLQTDCLQPDQTGGGLWFGLHKDNQSVSPQSSSGPGPGGFPLSGQSCF